MRLSQLIECLQAALDDYGNLPVCLGDKIADEVLGVSHYPGFQERESFISLTGNPFKD